MLLRNIVFAFVGVGAFEYLTGRLQGLGHVVLGGDNVPPPLVEIGLADLPKSGGHGPPACDGPDIVLTLELESFSLFK